MSSLEHNADRAALRLAAVGLRVRAELQRATSTLAQRVAARMREEAPKFRTTLANSVGAVQEDASGLVWQVYPTADYAALVNRGRKPGKGLPRFFDPASASIVAWLEGRIGDSARQANPKWRRGRVGSQRRTAAEIELRDRYMALSRHVKLHGIKANPYVGRTRDAMAAPVIDGLVAAVRRGAQGAVGKGLS